jgi:hypothetical protein
MRRGSIAPEALGRRGHTSFVRAVSFAAGELGLFAVAEQPCYRAAGVQEGSLHESSDLDVGDSVLLIA